MRAIIIAGGLGTRAHAMTGDRIPKALLPVYGVPIIFRQMRTLRREGVSRITVMGGHLGALLQEPLSTEARTLGITLDIVVEPQPLGTAGCLRLLGPVAEDALIVYGDMLFDLALEPLARFHRAQSARITIVAHPNDHPRTSDLVCERNGRVTGLSPRDAVRPPHLRNLVPAGIYLAAPGFFAGTGVERGDMVHDVLPVLAARGEVACYNTPEYMRDVGSPKRHAMAERDLADGLVEALHLGRQRPAVFFGLDGVLVAQGKDAPGEDAVLLAGAGAAVAAARKAGFLTIGLSRTADDADRADRRHGQIEGLLAEDGGVLDRICVAAREDDAMRSAAAELPIDLAGSMAIGADLRSMAAARAAGAWAFGVRTGDGWGEDDVDAASLAAEPMPDIMFANVSAAVTFATSFRTAGTPVPRVPRTAEAVPAESEAPSVDTPARAAG